MSSGEQMGYPLAIDSWDESEIKAINDVVDSNRYTMGPKVADFEERFADYFGSDYAIMVNSGSSANLVALASLCFKSNNALRPGDEVLVPAVSWSTTYYPVSQYNLKLKFVDINAQTLNIDIGKLREAITDKTKAIFAVNLLGNPCDLKALTEICEENDLYLIEDNCESMGATFNNKYAGTYGKLGTFSTFFSHHISTMEGGMIVTDDEELNYLCRSIRAHGWTRDLPSHFRSEDRKNEFYEMFNFILPGYNVRPLEMSGAIGLEQLKKLPAIVKGRRGNAELFLKFVKDLPDVQYQVCQDGSSWFGFSLVLTGNLSGKRNEVASILKENNIECRPIVAGNFTRNPVIKHLDHEIHGELSNADLIHENGFFIGNNHKDISSELEYFKNTFLEAIKNLS